MIFTPDSINKINKKRRFSKKYSRYFLRMYQSETNDIKKYYKAKHQNGKDKVISKKKTLYNKFYKMSNCSYFWLWDKYRKNEILDLKTISLCGYSECPNCRKVQLAKARLDFYPKMSKLNEDGYTLLHLVLTVPNCKGEELRDKIQSMGKAFSKFYRWLSLDDKKSMFKDRLIDVVGAYRVLEITNKYVKEDMKKHGYIMYHPHFHVILVVKSNYDNKVMIKDHAADYRFKSKSIIKYSELDLQLMKLWTLAYDNKSFSEYKKFDDDYMKLLKQKEIYRCNIDYIRGQEGIWEILKYTYKDSSMNNFKTFKTICDSIYMLRKKQGYGLLYGEFDFEGYVLQDEEKEDILQELLKIEEEPEIILTSINSLNKVYKNYTKISRYKISEEMDKIID